MSKLYRFSQIYTQEELIFAAKYVAEKTTELCQRITSKTYPISSITIFSHYPEEFERLKTFLLEIGNFKAENNGTYVELEESIVLPKGELKFLRVRKPDPYRMQVGCADFKVPDYLDFKEKFLGKSENLRLIKREDYEMIEFFDPDFDVLAYIVSKDLI